MPMESILTRDQRTTSHRVHDHAMRIDAPTSKSAISLLQQTKYQTNIVASCHCIKAITATTLKREKKSDSHLMPTFYHDRRTRHSNASFSVLRSLSKSKLPSHTYTYNYRLYSTHLVLATVIANARMNIDIANVNVAKLIF